MESADYKFCPSCKLRNKASAMVCEHCGSPLTSSVDPHATTTDVGRLKTSFQDSVDEKLEKITRPVPAKGIAIYLVGRPNPIEIRLENEFVMGRLIEPSEEKIVDLTAFDSYALGVSRRHLLVRRSADGYEVADLNSRNGSWVNDQKLEPQTPVKVRSGSVIRLGNMRLVLSFMQPEKNGEKVKPDHEEII